MSLTSPIIPEKLVLNRHSCEGAVGRNRAAKADLDIYHRSIQSDPGIRFDALKIGGECFYFDNMRKCRRPGNMRSTIFRRCDAGLTELRPGESAVLQPIVNPNSSVWYDGDLKFPSEAFRRYDIRRGKGFESHSMHRRIISTSLSSSATSLYSDDDSSRIYLSSSPSPSYNSDCPSVPPHSCRDSICCIEEESDSVEDETKSVELAKIQQNINNNNVSHESMAKLNRNCTHLNLNNNCQEDKSEAVSNKSEPPNKNKSMNVSNNAIAASSCTEKQSREVLVGHDLDELEECALSDRWLRDSNNRRWARIEGRDPTAEDRNPARKFSIGPAGNEDVEDSPGHREKNGVVDDRDQQQLAIVADGSSSSPSAGEKQLTKSKSGNLLKRFGGDFMKFGGFKMQKNQSDSKVQEQSSPINKTSSTRKSLRRNRKVAIGKPTLQSGQERLEKMKCVPIDISQSQSDDALRKDSIISSISSSASTSPTSALPADSSDSGSSPHSGSTLCEAPASKIPLNKENSLFLVPPTHKPGTFPTALRQHSELEDSSVPFSSPSSESSSRSHSASDFHHSSLINHSRKLSRPRSVYDNLDEGEHFNLTEELLKLLGVRPIGAADDSGVSSTDSSENHLPGVDVAFWSVDDVVEQTQSLQQLLGCWDSNEELNENSQFPLSSDEVPSAGSENVSIVEGDIEKNRLSRKEIASQLQSKWETIKRSGCACASSNVSNMRNLSAGQFMMLRRLAVLKLTSSMEKFNSKSVHTWSMPKFIRRLKEPDYKDKNVFGVPLLHNVQRFGLPIPPCILNALDHLRLNCLEHVGIFRKPGVRVRIQNLKSQCEENSNFNNFEDFSPFDVADLVKQYFRELPDQLMTVKLSETFVGIFQCISENQRLEALQCALILLPDENREALQTLLHFLLDVASKASENQMGSSNLSTCFAPSLFHLQINITKLTASASPRLKKQHGGKPVSLSTMKPNVKEMNDNSAATQCLSYMIEHLHEIFKVPEDGSTQFRMTVMDQPDDVLSSEIGRKPEKQGLDDYLNDFHSYIDRVVAATLREDQKISQNKTGSWQSGVGPSGSEIMSKKINDGKHLREWRSSVKVSNTSPDAIMRRILDERNLWDPSLEHSKVLQQYDERTQLYQSVTKEMQGHSSREYCVMRTWRKDASPRGTIVIVETSTSHPSSSNDVRGVVLTSRYVINPTDSPKMCTLTRVCRVDTKGRNPEWYNKTYGHLVARDLLRIRDSLQSKVFKSANVAT